MAYLCFYRKMLERKGFIKSNLIDMVMDSLGKILFYTNNAKSVAVV